MANILKNAQAWYDDNISIGKYTDVKVRRIIYGYYDEKFQGKRRKKKCIQDILKSPVLEVAKAIQAEDLNERDTETIVQLLIPQSGLI